MMSSCTPPLLPVQLQKTVESHSLERVLRAASPVFAAPFEHKLTEAAARRLTLLCKIEPSRCILGNTGSINVAAAECALAVRAAQRRTSRSQLNPSLHVHGHAWSALHHARQVRVRGRVLQQCRPPPALARITEALLPVYCSNSTAAAPPQGSNMPAP